MTPLTTNAAHAIIEPAAAKSMTPQAFRILLAEDDDGHANLVQRNLVRSGIANDIVRAHNGQEALDYIHRRGAHADRDLNGPLLLLLDINMPLVDGTAVLGAIKASEATAKIPVIMLTTTDDPREIQRCYELGCSVYVSKPVEYERFVEAVKRLGLFLQIVAVPLGETHSAGSICPT
jgi:CheY-like chemotaxis protein